MHSRNILLYVFTILAAVGSVYSDAVADNSLGMHGYSSNQDLDTGIPERDRRDTGALIHAARVHARARVKAPPKVQTGPKKTTQAPLKKVKPPTKKPTTTTPPKKTGLTPKAAACALKKPPNNKKGPGRLGRRTPAKGQKVWDALQAKRKAPLADKMTLAELNAKFATNCYTKISDEVLVAAGKELIFEPYIADIVSGGEQMPPKSRGWILSGITNECAKWDGKAMDKTLQKYVNTVNPTLGVIVAQNNDHGAAKRNSGLTWSDLAFMEYAEAAAAQDQKVSNIKMVLRDTITNADTQKTADKIRADSCIVKDADGMATLTFADNRDYFLELLGGANGAGVGYLLGDYAKSFGGKNIVSVKVDTSGDYNLIWIIG